MPLPEGNGVRSVDQGKYQGVFPESDTVEYGEGGEGGLWGRQNLERGKGNG